MITVEAARLRLWDAAYRHVVLETVAMAERPRVPKKKKSGGFADLKTMVVIGYRRVAGKVEDIKVLVLQIILVPEKTENTVKTKAAH